MKKCTFMVVFFLSSMITSGMGVKCYLQQCEKKDDVWSCHTKDDGSEKECNDRFAESNQENLLIRTCSNELPHGGPTKYELNGKICSEKTLMTRDMEEVTTTNCHCKTPMCNNITTLEKIELRKQ